MFINAQSSPVSALIPPFNYVTVEVPSGLPNVLFYKGGFLTTRFPPNEKLVNFIIQVCYLPNGD